MKTFPLILAAGYTQSLVFPLLSRNAQHLKSADLKDVAACHPASRAQNGAFSRSASGLRVLSRPSGGADVAPPSVTTKTALGSTRETADDGPFLWADSWAAAPPARAAPRWHFPSQPEVPGRYPG
ncbi:hypothetical protein B0H17DRAFT_1078282 [Mycena rosella]|uniref:Uncharacterized protein n=1 Tax=Mycena rosella TaxID=1033263 RepID=A0AAD7D4H0_MYCRO|nr:hypothetical protein B0H17DRAFT_1078282 [Mycena rosella]